MPLSDPRTIFGIHQMTAVSRTTGLPLGTIKVLASAESNREREQVDLFAGSNPNQWDSEDGNINSDITLMVKEFNPFLFELAGYTKTTNSAEATGGVSALTNKVGTSVFSATTGVASAEVVSNAETALKTGRYIIKAVSATTVDVYAVFDNDFSKVDSDGSADADHDAALTYVDDLLKITSSALTITTDTAVDIPNTGLTITGGSGTIAMTTSDVAYFDVRKINTGSYIYTYGSNPTTVEFEMWLSSQVKSNGEFVQHMFPRVKMSSMPSGLSEKAWSESSIAIKVLYDSTAGYSHKMIDLKI